MIGTAGGALRPQALYRDYQQTRSVADLFDAVAVAMRADPRQFAAHAPSPIIDRHGPLEDLLA